MAGPDDDGHTPKGLMPKVVVAMLAALVCAGILMWLWSRTTGQVATPGAQPHAQADAAPGR